MLPTNRRLPRAWAAAPVRQASDSGRTPGRRLASYGENFMKFGSKSLLIITCTLAALIVACGSSAGSLQASCDTQAQCANWNTAQTNACKDTYKNQATASDTKGCKTQLDAYTTCILGRARCEAGVWVTGGCASEDQALNTCVGGTTPIADVHKSDGGGGPLSGDCAARCIACGAASSRCDEACNATDACRSCVESASSCDAIASSCTAACSSP